MLEPEVLVIAIAGARYPVLDASLALRPAEVALFFGVPVSASGKMKKGAPAGGELCSSPHLDPPPTAEVAVRTGFACIRHRDMGSFGRPAHETELLL